MSVYIEFVLIDNFVINYIILYLSCKNSKKFRLSISSGLGAVVSVVYPFFIGLNAILSLLVKFILAGVMVFIVSGKGVKLNLYNNIMFFIYTFLLGGICFGILYMLCDVELNSGGLMYNLSVPIGVILGGVFAFIMLANFLKLHIKKSGFSYHIKGFLHIFIGEIVVKTTAMIDTGNLLIDTDTGHKVVVADKSILNEIKTRCSEEMLEKSRYMSISTASECNRQIFLFKPSKMLLYLKDDVHTLDNMMLGFTNEDKTMPSDSLAMIPYID